MPEFAFGTPPPPLSLSDQDINRGVFYQLAVAERTPGHPYFCVNYVVLQPTSGGWKPQRLWLHAVDTADLAMPLALFFGPFRPTPRANTQCVHYPAPADTAHWYRQ